MVPLVLGLGLSGVTGAGILFSVVWVAAYPCGFFAGRAIRSWSRRRRMTTVARRDARVAAAWAVPVALGGLMLAVRQPWLLVVAVGIALLWSVNLWLATRGLERSLTNDLILVVEAAVAVPLVWMVTGNDPTPGSVPSAVWLAALMCAVYLTGSIVHVKSLIRQRADPRWRAGNVAYHLFALIGMTLISWWLVVPFGAALIRSVALRPGVRPAVIGAIEIVVSLLVVVFGLVAL